MRNVGSCQCSLLGRFLIFATRNARAANQASGQRLSNAGSPPCAVMFTDSARSVA
jgi:hypothetical protein